jgi:hypothetical protein
MILTGKTTTFRAKSLLLDFDQTNVQRDFLQGDILGIFLIRMESEGEVKKI